MAAAPKTTEYPGIESRPRISMNPLTDNSPESVQWRKEFAAKLRADLDEIERNTPPEVKAFFEWIERNRWPYAG